MQKKEGMKMAIEVKAIRAPGAAHPDWETVKEWVKAVFTSERIADIVVCASTVTVLGMVLHTLHRASESCAIVGSPPF